MHPALPIVVVSALLCSLAADASDKFAEKCPDVPTCAKSVAALLGQKYLSDGDLKGKIDTAGDLELTQTNAENLFTQALHLNGYTRVPTGESRTYVILRQRDARDSNLPVVEADARNEPRIPRTWDLMTLKYKAANPEAVEAIAKLTRSFLPANARIAPAELSGRLIVTAAAMDLARIYELIRENDQKPTAEMKRRWADREKSRGEQELKRAPAPPPPQKPEG